MSEAATDSAFEALLEFLKGTRGLDLSGYKRASLERRFRRRLESVGCESYGDYLDYLQVHPDEFQGLFDTLLINVTEFFRDPPAWEHLARSVLPGLLEAKPAGEPIRVWSAGCASGQEAYTVAILLAEALGLDEYRHRVKIYATDIDEQALAVARQATYAAKEVEGVPPELRERYFEPADQRVAFRKDLRRSVIFGRNDLVQDAPISRLDILLCRNTLMYFNAETQARILGHFHFALLDSGTLVLGKSEMMVAQRDLFAAVDLRRRIFRKQPRDTLLARVAAFAEAGAVEVATPDEERAMRDAALELGQQAQLIVSRAGVVTFANLPARALFGIGLEDIGRPLTELPIASRPIDLRPLVERILRERRRVAIGEVPYRPERGEERRLDISAAPLTSASNAVLGVSILFEDVSRYAALQGELEGNRRDLELAYEELQSTIDELETTNEELQSSNEELETINDELRERTGELNRVNDFLETILTSLGVGVAVLDVKQRVQVWNHRAEDLWGLRSDEAVDHHFLSLDIGLPTERLAPDLRAVLGGNADHRREDLESVNRRGRSIVCEVTVLPLRTSGDGTGGVRGAIVLMEDR